MDRARTRARRRPRRQSFSSIRRRRTSFEDEHEHDDEDDLVGPPRPPVGDNREIPGAVGTEAVPTYPAAPEPLKFILKPDT